MVGTGPCHICIVNQNSALVVFTRKPHGAGLMAFGPRLSKRPGRRKRHVTLLPQFMGDNIVCDRFYNVAQVSNCGTRPSGTNARATRA